MWSGKLLLFNAPVPLPNNLFFQFQTAQHTYAVSLKLEVAL